jgi:hypothetical protein
MMTRIAVSFLVLGSSLYPAAPADKKAQEITQAMVNAMGGQDAWNRARYLRYDFRVTAGGKTVADRAHLWDKHTGRYRLEGTTKEGARQIVLFNTATQQGSVYQDGKKLEGAANAAAIKQAYGSFINDFYWLAMPWKWTDQGVHLRYLGKRKSGGHEYDVVQLTFDHVGLTPGDRYEAFVSPTSHLMEHWEYTLQSGNKGSWNWEYTTTEGIKLASNHTGADGRTINHGNPRVLTTVDDAYFSDAARQLASLK